MIGFVKGCSPLPVAAPRPRGRPGGGGGLLSAGERAKHKPTAPRAAQATMSAVEVDKMLKPVMLKDLRIQCRVRGLSPAGGKDQLAERLRDAMIATGD